MALQQRSMGDGQGRERAPLPSRALVSSHPPAQLPCLGILSHLLLQGQELGRKMPCRASWSSRQICWFPGASRPRCPVALKAGLDPTSSGTRTGRAWPRHARIRALTACCCPAAPSSSPASCTGAARGPTRVSTPVWLATTWEQRPAEMPLWK